MHRPHPGKLGQRRDLCRCHLDHQAVVCGGEVVDHVERDTLGAGALQQFGVRVDQRAGLYGRLLGSSGAPYRGDGRVGERGQCRWRVEFEDYPYRLCRGRG